ncbi:MAG: hypothetical protein M3R43_08550 [Acidobacteriota bacterium]|nr:hypothetical protein [Acidobacteriota bacterium]
MNALLDREPEALQIPGATDVAHGIEKFTSSDLTALRSDLLQSGVDSFQAAELVANFLSGRGYGVSNDEARGVASAIEGVGCTVECIQAELERVAHFA